MNQFQNLLYKAGKSEQGTRIVPGRPGGSLGITPLNEAWGDQIPMPKPYHPGDNPYIDPGHGNPYHIPGTGNWSFINQPSYRLAGTPIFNTPWGPDHEARHRELRANYAKTPEGQRLEQQILKLRNAINLRGV